MTLITVTIPIFNVDKYLEKCLESIRCQSFKDFEVFMVDDCSTDYSVSIAKKYEQMDSRFHSVIQEKGGPGRARNYGIDHASGKYLAFIDGDDYIHERYLEKMYEAAEKNNADLVTCGVLRVRENGTFCKSAIANDEDKIVTDVEQYLLSSSHVCWDKLFRKELFSGIYFPEHMTKQDYACVPRVIAKAKKIVCISDQLYYYLWRENSITNSIKVNMNLMKAQNILETSPELSGKYEKVLEAYFVRNIMGSLLWTMMATNTSRDEIRKIMEVAKKRYPQILESINDNNMGDARFGIMLYKGHYGFAKVYVITIETGKKVLRPIYRRIKYRRKTTNEST